MKVIITVNGTKLRATLLDNPSAKDLASMLPLRLRLEDYGSNEKIGYLPRKLTTAGSAPFSNETIGDLAYYAPWGNFIFYYGPYRYSQGVIRLGKMIDDMAPLLHEGVSEVRIELLAEVASD